MAPRPNQDVAVAAMSSPSNNNLNKNIVMQHQANSKESGFVNQGFENDVKGDSSQVPQQQPTPSKIMDFDDFLPYVGEFGKYQKILFLWMIPFSFFIAFVYFSQLFMIVVPEEHNCLIPDLQHLSREDRLKLAIPQDEDGKFSKCHMYDVEFSKLEANSTPSTEWPIVNCRFGWEYVFSNDDIPYESIATQNDWVCEKQSLSTIAQSFFFGGAIIGGLLFGYIADRGGRIPALIGSNILGFAAGIGTAYSNNFWQFSLARFFAGFAFDNCFTMMYILVLEYVGPKYRTFVANMSIAIFFTFAASILPWIAYWINDWRLFTIATSAPLAFAVFTPWFVPESARWLVSTGKIDKAVNLLKKVATKNGKHDIDPNLFDEFQESCKRMNEEESKFQNYSVLDLFKTPRLRRITLLLIIIWMAISLVFDGHVRNVGNLGLNIFVTFSIGSATEFPADTLLTLTLDRWGRRWLACGSLILSGFFSILATSVQDYAIAFASLALVGRFFVNISYNIGLQYAAEILPTVVRAQGVTFIHIMGYIASMIAPFIADLGKVAMPLPLVILGIVGIISGVLALFLPETLGHELPQSLTDGENFGLGQKLLDAPCCMKNVENESCEIKREDIRTSANHFVRGSTGATLRSSIRGELASNLLTRSFRNNNSLPQS